MGSALVVPATAAGWLVPDAHIPLVHWHTDIEALDEGVLRELSALFADVVPFDYTLSAVSRFPGGDAYLAPRPAAPFRHLTTLVRRRFPDLAPPAPPFDEAVPHLPLPPGQQAAADQVQAQLDRHGPIKARAQAAVLRADPGGRVELEFHFGTSAA